MKNEGNEICEDKNLGNKVDKKQGVNIRAHVLLSSSPKEPKRFAPSDEVLLPLADKFLSSGVEPSRVKLWLKHQRNGHYGQARKVLRKKVCGARKKNGDSCMATPVPDRKNGRCKFHGGKSTGPRTPEGRERSRQAVLKRWEKFYLDRIIT